MDLSSDEKLALGILLFLVFLGSILVIWRNAWWLKAPDSGFLAAWGDDNGFMAKTPFSRDGIGGENPITGEEGGEVEASDPVKTSGENGDVHSSRAPIGSDETDRRIDADPDRALSAVLVVHVAGAVKEPGVYVLAEDARVKDAVDAAGGPVPEAAVHFLNLAEPLVDGQKIYVPTVEEAKKAQRWEEQVASERGYTSGAPGKTVFSIPTGGSGPAGNSSKVNINTATVAQLDALPGIGPVLAERIVRSRSEEGPFDTVDDLKRVRGIGDSLLKELKNLITVK